MNGTHIRLSAAIGGERDYYNRKRYPSIQLQVKHIIDLSLVVIEFLLKLTVSSCTKINSSVYTKAEAGELFSQNYHIFGDNAYPLRNWLVSPIKNFGNLTRQQIKFLYSFKLPPCF
ncbi:uncharacterized protein LOC127732254 [Mytilus californianus]|uniref:uncharacterized protein LOC127732254 n=1 Tax=Mytilus californianus TaxID=6549 RepID=UPI00224842C2|nr:uncharacterized protein LOC127732254 [Mytilus californianus]